MSATNIASGVIAGAPIEIRAENLHDSPTNPRKTYSDAALQELADNIKGIGRILQPLLVRPRIPALFAGDPDTAAGYEIVFGHRRKRAGCDIAGLATAPCMVRSMTDAEVEAAQISENLQRVDVHAIEEAEGFAGMIQRHDETAESLAEKYGKSTSHIYGRLALLKLAPEIRAACVAGEIDVTVAGLFGRLRSHKLQGQAMAQVRRKFYDPTDGGKKSFRSIADFLRDRYTLALDSKSTPFAIDDAVLVPAAGSCAACPKRSGNAPEFDDVTRAEKRNYWDPTRIGPNVCTDPDCFATKKAAQFKREAEALAAAGKAVVDGTRARNAIDACGNVKGAYIEASKVRHALQDAKKAAARDKTLTAPAVVTLQDPRTGKTYQAVKRSELLAAGVVSEEEMQTRPKVDQATASRMHAERVATEHARRGQALGQVRAAIAAAPRSLVELRIVATALASRVQWPHLDQVAELWGCAGGHQLQTEIDTMGPDDLGRLLLDCLLVPEAYPNAYSFDRQPETLDALALQYGLALVGAEPSAGASTLAPAAQAEAGAAMAGGESAPGTAAQAESGAHEGDAATPGPAAQARPEPEWNPEMMAAHARRKAAAAAGDQVNQVSIEAGCAGDHDGQAVASKEAP